MSMGNSRGATSTGRNSDESRFEGTEYDTAEFQRGGGSVPVHDEHVEPAHTGVRQTAVRDHPTGHQRESEGAPVNVAVAAERQDGVRWGPIWAGLLTALTTFILLELMFYAFGWLTLDLGADQLKASRWVTSGILALLAFFLGGLIAGATTIWKGLFSGLLHGFLVWALGVGAFIAVTFFGGSALLGSFGTLAHELGVGPQQVQSTTNGTNSQVNKLTDSAKDSATPAFWGLVLPLGSAMLGGLIGSKIWPRRKDTEPETFQLRS